MRTISEQRISVSYGPFKAGATCKIVDSGTDWVLVKHGSGLIYVDKCYFGDYRDAEEEELDEYAV